MPDRKKQVRDRAQELFSEGWFCGESVIVAVSEAIGQDFGLPPKVATGFCSGMGRCGGTCGALSGGVLMLSAAEGRNDKADSVEGAYEAVQMLVDGFEEAFGSSNCAELLGCHLGTPEGQKAFADQNLALKCQGYSAKAAELVTEILDMRAKARGKP